MKHRISFAKYQNESATGIHVPFSSKYSKVGHLTLLGSELLCQPIMNLKMTLLQEEDAHLADLFSYP